MQDCRNRCYMFVLYVNGLGCERGAQLKIKYHLLTKKLRAITTNDWHTNI